MKNIQGGGYKTSSGYIIYYSENRMEGGMGLKKNSILTDYKFFCFNGIPKVLYVSKDYSMEARTDFFDMEYNRLPIRMRDPNSDEIPARPANFEKMKSIAAKLSAGIPHIRIDFYEIDGRLYVGELTFYHCSGFALVKPEEWNIRLGEWINIDNIKRKQFLKWNI